MADNARMDDDERQGEGLVPLEENLMDATGPFFLRYYTGHKGKFGHEFLGM
jgi:hypothetical protein